MESLNLQILEKRSQEFDGVVGQDNGQNSKSLMSWEKTTKKRLQKTNAHINLSVTFKKWIIKMLE